MFFKFSRIFQHKIFMNKWITLSLILFNCGFIAHYNSLVYQKYAGERICNISKQYISNSKFRKIHICIDFEHFWLDFHWLFDRISWIFQKISIFSPLREQISPRLMGRFQKVYVSRKSTLRELSIALCFIVIREKLVFHRVRWKFEKITNKLCHPHSCFWIYWLKDKIIHSWQTK